MPGTFKILDSVGVPMRDDVVLPADIWLPDGEGPWPVLLQRTPYRREDAHGAQYISAFEFQSALRRGFAIVMQDTRGRFGAGGDFDPFTNEADDGADTVAWLRRQPFCDGRVAMFGSSYVGATQVLAAAARPEGLVAISPHLTTARHGETWMYRGGAIELGFLMLWIIEALGGPDLERRLAGLDKLVADRLSAFFSELMKDPDAAFARLPILEDDIVSLAPYAARWFDSERAAAAHADRERLDDLAASDASMLVSAGWNDLFVEGSLELFGIARARHARAEDVRDRLIVGPWSHGNPKDWQGAFWHGYTASTAGLSDMQMDFFDAVMKNKTPPGPMVRYFRSGSNSWHAAPDWPLPATTHRVFHLAGERLTDEAQHKAWSRTYVSDPSNPVPTVGGATFLPGLLLGRNSGQMEQAAIEGRKDVLIFTSDPLPADLEVTGFVEARISVHSSAPTADWTARLCEVHADGSSYGIVDGIRRWTPDADAEKDASHAVTIGLGHTSHLFRAGSRIRLQIASSNFPRFDRNPQTGVPASRAKAGDLKSATQTILGGPDAPCFVRLPTILNPYPQMSGLNQTL